MVRYPLSPFFAAVLLGATVGCDSMGQDRAPLFVDMEACPEGEPPSNHPPVYGQIDRDPAWSPDDRRLAYLKLGRHSPAHELWILDLQTGEQRLLREGVNQLAWFPSGDSLLVSLEAYYFHVLDLDGNVIRPLAARGFFPDVSPDGQLLAWDFEGDIWMMDLTTGDRWMIEKDVDTGDWRAGSWSPDGTRYAHLRYVGPSPLGNESVFTMAAAGNDPERITTEPITHRTPQWSPDGRYIAFPSKGCPWLTDILAYDFETGRRIRLTREGGLDPSWSPDGEWIAYVKHNTFLDPEEHVEEGQGYVHVRNIYTGEERQVTFPPE
jgi:Tol biopolymer transport system component